MDDSHMQICRGRRNFRQSLFSTSVCLSLYAGLIWNESFYVDLLGGKLLDISQIGQIESDQLRLITFECGNALLLYDVPVPGTRDQGPGTRKVRPKHVSALVLRQLVCARQPMTGRRDARLLAGMLDFFVSKYYLASANILERQQDFVSVSKYYLSSANMRERQQIILSVSKYYLASANILET